MSASRRLAAILVADVVGYSRMMEADERGTLAALKERRRAILEPTVREHGGRIVKVMGDGVLIEFASAVNAVQGALELQRKMAEANGGLPDAHRIVLRIGINLGDVIGEGSDIYGESVNLAARLEALAEPGGICVSAKVREEVRGKIDAQLEDMGEQSLKNIAALVRSYRVHPHGFGSMLRPSLSLPDKPSIAVLPFTNMSGDPEQAYFADGITEDIITELSRFSSLLVIARNSSFQYRDRAQDMKKIGRELGARYLVEGSVRRLGPSIRISAQVINSTSGQHLWAERYDRKIDDLFAVQDEVVRAVVTTSEHGIADSKADHRRRAPPDNWAAYDHILQARQCLEQYGRYLEAEPHLRRALQLDPKRAEPHAMLAHVALLKYWMDAERFHIEDGLMEARRALDDRDSSAHAAMAMVAAFRGEFDLAFLHSDRALALNPNNVLAAVNRAVWQAMCGDSEQALAALDLILNRDLFPAKWYWEARGVALFHLRRYAEAVEALRLTVEPQFWERGYIAAALALYGRQAEAQAEIARIREVVPGATISRLMICEPYNHIAGRNHHAEGLRKAGLPE